jgi:tetratricopeptide (TPR) repeat protein
MKKIPKRRRSRKQAISVSHKRGSHRAKWILGSIGLVMAVSVAVVFWMPEAESPSQPNISPPPASIADTEGVQADEIEAVLSQKAETVAEIQAEELKLAQHLVDAFPNDASALVLLGSVYRHHGDSAKNMELWNQALAINPQHPDLYQRLGEAAHEKGELDQALAYWKQGLDINPQSPNLRWFIAKTYMEQGQHEQAIDLLIEECAITPNATRNYYLLGQVYLQLKAYEKAKANYLKAIELSSTHYNAFFGLANACMRLKERAKATEHMKTFQKLKKKFDASKDQRIHADEIPQTRQRTAHFYLKAYDIYQQAGQAKKAENLLLRARQLNPNDTVYLENLAAHYYRDNRLSAALETYEEASAACNLYATRYPDSDLLDSYWYMIGYCHFATSEHKAALEMCRKVAEHLQKDEKTGRTTESSNKWRAIYILGQVHHSLGEAADAIEEYRRVEDRFADAKQSIMYFTRKHIGLPEVTTVKPNDKVKVELKFRNIAACDTKVYRIDLMKFSLLKRNLGGITGINLAGIRPHHEETIKLGDGKDYKDCTRELALPLKEEGAYLVVCRGENLHASGLVLVTPLAIEVQEDSISGRVRTTVKDLAADKYLRDVHVKVIGSSNSEFKSGSTDLRGVFVADDIRGTSTVIAQTDKSRYAFFRGETHLGKPPAARQAKPSVQAESIDNNADLLKGLKGKNFKFQQEQGKQLQQMYDSDMQGVEAQKAF